MDVLQVPFTSAAFLLAIAGVQKLRDPHPLSRALRLAKLPNDTKAVRSLAAIEIATAVCAVVIHHRVVPLVVAALYLSFAVFVMGARAKPAPRVMRLFRSSRRAAVGRACRARCVCCDYRSPGRVRPRRARWYVDRRSSGRRHRRCRRLRNPRVARHGVVARDADARREACGHDLVARRHTPRASDRATTEQRVRPRALVDAVRAHEVRASP